LNTRSMPGSNSVPSLRVLPVRRRYFPDPYGSGIEANAKAG